MAAYTFRAVGSIASNNDSSALSPGAPAGKATGDLLLLSTINRAATGAAIAAIAGWTALSNADLGATNGVVVLGRIADGSATDTPSPDWTGTNDSAAWIEAYYGDVWTTLSTIVAHTAESAPNSSDNTIFLDPVTITTADTMVFCAGRKSISTVSDDQTAITVTPEFTRTGHFPNTSAGNNDISGASAYWQQTTAANYDGDDWTCDGSSVSLSSSSVILSLKTLAASSIMNQIQGANLGSDLFNGTLA